MKLRDTALLSLFIGSLFIWALEVRRAGFLESYPALMMALVFLFAYQFFRYRDRQTQKTVSPTIRQMIETRKKVAAKKAKK